MDESARVLRPNRAQLVLRPIDFEKLLPADHRARAVWDWVQSLDLSRLYDEIGSVEGSAGRPAIDPGLLVALWIYATSEGVGSARALARQCEEHDAYRWLCGGVSVSAHTLSDFRVSSGGVLDELLTQSVGRLMHVGLLTLQRVAQDGLRVRASAGAGSFRRRAKLRECLHAAREEVKRLRAELESDPSAVSRREAAARERAAQERQSRIMRALGQLRDEEQRQAKRAEARPDRAERETRKEPRASTTDPEARVMRMADGGYRPAYNAQLATDAATQIIVGVRVSREGTDLRQLEPMVEQLIERFGTAPAQYLVDGGFVNREPIERVAARGCRVYAPLPVRARTQAKRVRPESPEIAAWRRRMQSPGGRAVYRQRGQVAECVNAIARNRGLKQLGVRGLEKARAVVLWFALAHNALRSLTLLKAAAAT